MNKVRWNEDERAAFFGNVMRFHEQHHATGKMIAAMAMAEMPSNRRRPLFSQLVVDVNKHIRQYRGKGNGTSIKGDSPFKEVQADLAAVTSAHEYGLATNSVQDTIVDFAVDVIERVLTHPAVLQAANVFVQAAFKHEAAEALLSGSRWPDSPVTARLPRVLVVGPREREFVELEEQFGQQLSLRYWNIDKSIHQFKGMANGAAIIVAWIPRIPHRVMNSLSQRSGQFIRAMSLNDLKSHLTRIATEQK
jgi:hypothetical protein